jgi:hypothetical protein
MNEAIAQYFDEVEARLISSSAIGHIAYCDAKLRLRTVNYVSRRF